MAEPPELRIRRNRWFGFVNGFSSGIGFGIFLMVIVVWFAFSTSAQGANMVGFVILALIAGLSIFLVSLSVEFSHQAKLGQLRPSAVVELPDVRKLCSKCGSEMRFVPQHRKYYCANCKSYE